MVTGFNVTFERYLPHDDGEDICEADESGFVIEDVSLRDAMRLGLEYQRPSWAGACECDGYPVSRQHPPRWLTFHDWNDGTRDRYEQGVHESRSLHIPASVTASSAIRIARLFGAYGVK